MRLGGIGDNLIASSVLPFLRGQYGRVEVITKAPWHVVFENNPYVDKLSVWPENAEGGPNFHAEVDRMAKTFDFFINLTHSIEHTLAFFEGQTEFWWPAAARRFLADRSYLEFTHRLCGDDSGVFRPQFFPTDAERERALATIERERMGRTGPVIGWVVSGSRPDKLHPHSAVVIGRLLREFGATVMLFGGVGRDRAFAQAINEQVQIAGGLEGLRVGMTDEARGLEWPVRRSLTQLQACDLVITPDTGPGWAVAAAPMPKILLHSHASVRNIATGWVNTISLHADPARVPCWPCHRLHDEPGRTCRKAEKADAAACIADIPVQAIIEAAAAALSGGELTHAIQ